MQTPNRKTGMSIIEILMYVAILSIIGVVLSNYFIAALGAQTEHDRRNDLANGAQDIINTMRGDLVDATQVVTPLSSGTSTVLTLVGSLGGVLIEQNGDALVRISGSSTRSITSTNVVVENVSFTRREYFEQRLNATTTSIGYHVLLSHKAAPAMLRTIDGALFVGKDGL